MKVSIVIILLAMLVNNSSAQSNSKNICSSTNITTWSSKPTDIATVSEAKSIIATIISAIGLKQIDKPRPQRTDADPGAAGELEVLGNAAVEIEAGVEIPGIGRPDRIAEFVKALLVEGSRGQLRLPPIARRDVGAPGAHLELAIVGNELGFVAGDGKPDMAGTAGGGANRHEERRGLGGA